MAETQHAAVRLQRVSAVVARAHALQKLYPDPWKVFHLSSTSTSACFCVHDGEFIAVNAASDGSLHDLIPPSLINCHASND